jgi:hypothetical protein
MFKEEREEPQFTWDMIGDITEGRPNLGNMVEVSVYRLMQFTLREILINNFDVKTADKIFYQAGKLAGRELCKNLLNTDAEFNDFIIDLQEWLAKLKIGILHIEKADFETMNFTITLAEDLDCSGLPVCEEIICTYDEGFLRGILLEYTGKEFNVKEVDCWCSGDRVCRFNASPAID